MLNKQEQYTLWYILLFAMTIAGVAGYIAGHATGPVYKESPTDSVRDVPNKTVTEQVIAASLDGDTVDTFCEKQGYRAGYPTANTGQRYMIGCYDDRNGQRVREEFSLFEDFADYVEQGDFYG